MLRLTQHDLSILPYTALRMIINKVLLEMPYGLTL